MDAHGPGKWRTHPQIGRARTLQLGVATSGFQCEGALDLPGHPSTHWLSWQRAGRIEPIGEGAGLWERFTEAARRAQRMGLRRFRMGVEWARLCPRGDVFDEAAVEGYAAHIATLRAHGLEPIVTLLHFTHPAWLGLDFWLDADAPARFARYAREAAQHLGRALVRRGERPIERIITLNEPNMLALASYAAGVFPHGAAALAEGAPRGFARTLRCLDALMAGHSLAWRALHELYAREAWPAPDVSTNINALDLHTFSKGVFDLLRATAFEIPRSRLGDYMADCRRRHHATLFEGEATSRRARVAETLDAGLARLAPPYAFEHTLSVLHERRFLGRAPLDHVAIDVYDPFSAQQVRNADALLAVFEGNVSLPALAALDFKKIRLAEPWEWGCEPGALLRVLRAYAWPTPALPIDVDENGMCVRRDAGGEAVPREDGVTRDVYLRAYLSALLDARVVEDLPVRAYCHWTFVDNYELGRWSPRFGLFGITDARVWSAHDAAGQDAAGTYGAIGVALREGEDDALRRALRGAIDRE